LKSTSNDHQRNGVIDQVVQSAMNDREMAGPAKRILQDEYANTSNLQNRERLVAGISDINFSQQDLGLRERGYVSYFDDQFVGVMLFDWPILLVGDEVWELGDWVTADGYQGYLASMTLTHIVLKDGRETHRVNISTPIQMTALDWRDKNIYIRGKQANMHTVIHAFERLGFDVLEEGQGGAPGVISGYFSFATPEAFLEEVKDHLKLTVSGKTIWIEGSTEFRTYIPLFHYYVPESSCEALMTNLMQYTGFNFSIASYCDAPLSLYCINSELKAVIRSVGFEWRPNPDAGQFGITFFRKE
jgi:hypothetical protein